MTGSFIIVFFVSAIMTLAFYVLSMMPYITNSEIEPIPKLE